VQRHVTHVLCLSANANLILDLVQCQCNVKHNRAGDARVTGAPFRAALRRQLSAELLDAQSVAASAGLAPSRIAALLCDTDGKAAPPVTSDELRALAVALRVPVSQLTGEELHSDEVRSFTHVAFANY
jgi:hypothetical protein